MSTHAAIVKHFAAKPLSHADFRLSTMVTSIESTPAGTQDNKVAVRSIGVSSNSTRLWLRFRWVA